MGKNVKVFFIGFITAIVGALLFIISRGDRSLGDYGSPETDRNNSGLRSSFNKVRDLNDGARIRNNKERELIKTERDRIKTERGIVKDARNTISGIIKDSSKPDNNK